MAVVLGSAEKSHDEGRRAGLFARASSRRHLDVRPELERLAGLAERAPHLRRADIARCDLQLAYPRAPHEKHLHPASGLALATEESRRNDAGVVDDHERAGGEKLGELGDSTVLGSDGARRQQHQPRELTVLRRSLGDELGG
jgi:hypothetical protein